MGSLDRSSHVVHAACATGTPGRPTPTYDLLRRIPGVRLRAIDLGPELSLQPSRWAKLKALVATLPAILSCVRLLVYIRRNGIELIHTSDRPRDAFAAVLLGRLTGARSVVHAHVAYGEWMSPLLKWSLARADALIAVSRFVARSLVESGHRPSTTYVVLNAIDAGAWQPGVGRDEARRELAVEACPVVITVCRLFPGKGPGDLIRALAIVRRDQPAAKLVIVGQDVSPGGSYVRELSMLADELGVGDSVIFTGRRGDVPRLMAGADVFAMPSLEEPFGLVYVEAMAMRLPVVALDSGGTPEVVEHRRTGLLSRPHDLDALAANMVELLSDADLRGRLGEHGRRDVEEQFSVDRQGRDVAEVYRLILSARARGSEQFEGAGHAVDIGG
jgi:glycosyltransferase involved in cell wall biosynthesis